MPVQGLDQARIAPGIEIIQVDDLARIAQRQAIQDRSDAQRVCDDEVRRKLADEASQCAARSYSADGRDLQRCATAQDAVDRHSCKPPPTGVHRRLVEIDTQALVPFLSPRCHMGIDDLFAGGAEPVEETGHHDLPADVRRFGIAGADNESRHVGATRRFRSAAT